MATTLILLFLSLICQVSAYRLKFGSIGNSPVRLIPKLRSSMSDKASVAGRSAVKHAESGAQLELVNVNLCIGNNDIISDINWNIMAKERWALVGKNGAGIPYAYWQHNRHLQT